MIFNIDVNSYMKIKITITDLDPTYDSGWQFNRIFWPPKSSPNSSPTRSRSPLGGLLGGLKIQLNCHPGAQIPYDEAHPCSVGFRTSYAEEGYEALEEFRFVFLPKFLSGSERRLRLNGGKFFVGDSVQYSTLHCRVHH